MFHEYPKCVYLAGDVSAAYRVVADAAGEAQARREGFQTAGESPEKAKRKPRAAA